MRHGVQYLVELFAFTDDDFCHIRNIGRKAVHEAQMLVLEYKLKE